MHILALEPYYGGSHQAFLDGWIAASRHRWTKLTLPAHHWKWRMRHAPLTFARQVADLSDPRFDLIFASDMLNLPVFRGMVPPAIAHLPALIYFHENQLTYPDDYRTERDYHYAFDNFQTMVSADVTWFNSAYHRSEFTSECHALLRRFPDYSLEEDLKEAVARSKIAPPGLPEIDPIVRPIRREHPHVVWAARWESDKNPGDFFAALRLLKQSGYDFRLSVVGESFRDVPAEFAAAQEEFAAEIQQWGFLPRRSDYLDLLASADLFVSTALHEFFGISAAEAILSGCLPVLPRRLAYPELVDDASHLLYDGSIASLAQHIQHLTNEAIFLTEARKQTERVQLKLARLCWSQLAMTYDQALDSLAEDSKWKPPRE